MLTPGPPPKHPVRTLWHSPNPGIHRLPAPSGFRSLDPGRATGIHEAGGKLVVRLQSPLPDSCPPVFPAVRSSVSFQSPPSHLPASAARPGLRRPVSQSCPPVPELHHSAGPVAGAASSPEPGGGRGQRAPRASERAGGLLELRRGRRARPHPLRPRSLPLSFPTSRPPPCSRLPPSVLPHSPFSLSLSLFDPFRSCSLALSFSYLFVSFSNFPWVLFFSDTTLFSISSHHLPTCVLSHVSLIPLFSLLYSSLPFLLLLTFSSLYSPFSSLLPYSLQVGQNGLRAASF